MRNSWQKLTLFTALLLWTGLAAGSAAAAGGEQPPTPVRVAAAQIRVVANQVVLIGTAEPVVESLVACEISGIVEDYPIREGAFVHKGDLLVRLRATELELRLAAAEASRERIRARFSLAEKELTRFRKLKDTDSIADNRFDEVLSGHQALNYELRQSEAEISRLQYAIAQTKVFAPFSGFVAQEHTQVGEWVTPGGPVARLLDLHQILILVDVPERYLAKLAADSKVRVEIVSIPDGEFSGSIYAVLPEGDADARSFPVKVALENPRGSIKSGMEAAVTFPLTDTREALLVPKDAVVLAGNDRLVYAVLDNKAVPVPVKVTGYFEDSVAVEGQLAPQTPVVVRGNERLRPGQTVQITE